MAYILNNNVEMLVFLMNQRLNSLNNRLCSCMNLSAVLTVMSPRSSYCMCNCVIVSVYVCLSQAKHIMSCYWGASSTAAERHDQSLPYLEQYRIDCGQFIQLFSALAPWSCGLHTKTLSSRLFRLLDQNKDSLINFKEFVTGLSEWMFTPQLVDW